MEYKITSHDMNDTLLLAQNIESEKFPNMVICLNGELGTGKTVFVKGFAGALGIKDPITSPTFNIVKEYLNGELPLYHMDVYRLENGADEIGLDDYLFGEGVCVIEWASMISDLLPSNRLDIKIYRESENERRIELYPIGPEYETISEVLKKC